MNAGAVDLISVQKMDILHHHTIPTSQSPQCGSYAMARLMNLGHLLKTYGVIMLLKLNQIKVFWDVLFCR
jgi:hypothetical protein